MQDKIVFYFIIYSFLGWCLESIYKTIILKKPINSGFLYGPVCPMYGIGAIIMIGLSTLSDNIIIIFILSFVVFSLWEYVVAVILEKCFKTRYWDYSDLKFNFQGRVCLKNSIYWGILGVVLIYLIQPNIERLTSLIPAQMLLYIDIILCLAILVDTIITIFRSMIIDRRINELFNIMELLKEKAKELKQEKNLGKVPNENIQNIIKELKTKQDILKIKIYKRIIRMKKAFPEMHSENITKFMKQHVLIEDIKEKIKKYKER